MPAELNRAGSDGSTAFYSVRVYRSTNGAVDMGRGLDGCSRIDVALAIDDKLEAEWLATKLQEQIIMANCGGDGIGHEEKG